MNYKEKLGRIRESMKQDGVSAYIIPSSDPHISEYVPSRYKCVKFASGFTGSAGTLVITADFAGLWTDGRYFVQANEQLEGSGFELVKLEVQQAPEYITWLYKRLDEGAVVAADSQLLSVMLGTMLTEKLSGKNISFVSRDYLDAIWENRPALPVDNAFLLNTEVTGAAVTDKLAVIREKMKDAGVAYHLVSSLDDNAWIFNMRGQDVSYNPVVLCFSLITPDTATLFINPDKLTDTDKQSLLASGVMVTAYQDIEGAIAELPADKAIWIDPARTCFGLFRQMPQGMKVIRETNPSTFLKAVKNTTEIEHTRKVMVRDGVAIVKFLKWVEETVGNETVTELSAAARLKDFRQEQEGYIGNSFNTISAYAAHGALPHYGPTEESNVEVLRKGLFLVDSGGQYAYGTTDITRVIPMGDNTDQECIDYTLVLKGMIGGVKARFPKGTRGYQIDAITRQPIWEHGINYGHGTGHGVGFFLNVHEGPHVFNASNNPVAIELGMITSIEPGIYRAGSHGIRIENLVLTVADEQNDFDTFYRFESLTLAPIDTSIVRKELLHESHIEWLNAYHATVYEKLSPLLSAEEAAWLKQKTSAI